MQKPLLYVPPVLNAILLEEASTSIYQQSEPASLLVLHQLRYFYANGRKRSLYFYLHNGESLVGTIQALRGEEVLVKTFEQQLWLSAASIAYIK